MGFGKEVMHCPYTLFLLTLDECYKPEIGLLGLVLYTTLLLCIILHNITLLCDIHAVSCCQVTVNKLVK